MKETITIQATHLNNINQQTLESIIVKILGFSYRAQSLGDQSDIIVEYYPRSFSAIYYNSFLPVMTVLIKKESEAEVYIKSAFRKSVRIGLIVLYAILLFCQIAILLLYIQSKMIGVALFFPLLMAVFLFALSNGTKAMGTRLFIKEYLKQIEQLTTNIV